MRWFCNNAPEEHAQSQFLCEKHGVLDWKGVIAAFGNRDFEKPFCIACFTQWLSENFSCERIRQ